MALSLPSVGVGDGQVADIAVTRYNGLAGLAGLVLPCVVKNTFLHVTSKVHVDRHREQSAPPRLAELVPEDWEACCFHRQNSAVPSGSMDFSAAETDDTGALADEADAMNGACSNIYSDISWMQHGARQLSTSRNISALSGDPEAPPTSWACGWQKTREACAHADTGSTFQGFVQQEDRMQGGTGGSGGSAHGEWWSDGVTTVMIRQLPCRLSQCSFMAAINKRGYEGLYDFLYLPHDHKRNINVGYGFINFIEPEYAQAFRAELDGTILDMPMKTTDKPLRVHPARTQGYESNYRHFSQTKTGVNQDPEFSPLFFRYPKSAEPPAAGAPAASCALPAQPHAAVQPRLGGGAATSVLFEGQPPHGGAQRQPVHAERQVEVSPWAGARGPLCFGEAAGPVQKTTEAWAVDLHHQQLHPHGCEPQAGVAVTESIAPSSSGPTSSYRCPRYQFRGFGGPGHVQRAR